MVIKVLIIVKIKKKIKNKKIAGGFLKREFPQNKNYAK